ncbi:headcase protein [Lingula anatina]|uniref:Headcase protein n=1 Tax=Lingula anatina TaxID=7574 RepID=A0A1S3JWE5_LINAN|nr:headcase protein [Lingula anatina]|eukprot:XP_013414750.1 headcase protein [Lingula anatina]
MLLTVPAFFASCSDQVGSISNRMPRHQRGKSKEAHENAIAEDAVRQEADNNGNDTNQNVNMCCLPTGCSIEEAINVNDPGDAVRVECNNDQCSYGNWMHRECFDAWEETVLSFLRSCGRARSWSEKQRLQNLWTKKGYDLAFKACDCKCGKGHLRKDLNYIPKTNTAQKQKKHKKKTDKALPVINNSSKLQQHHCNSSNANVGGGSNGNGGYGHHTNKPNLHVRIRAGSLGSTGSISPTSSSPPLSSTPPVLFTGSSNNNNTNHVNNNILKKVVSPRLDNMFADPGQAATGNIFKRRPDLTAFNTLPRYQQNPYHIKMEDEGPHGNDDMRCFILANLSTYKCTSVPCVLCGSDLPVFDRYPLIDGTFFLSPLRYNNDIKVEADGRVQYLNAACMSCLEGGCELRCCACRKRWYGNTLLLGGMYSYDIFAAMPCCQMRLTCKSCRRIILDASTGGLQFYSQYSRSISCPACKNQDYHFVKPLQECFLAKQQTIWNC